MDVTRCRRTDGKKWRCGKNVVPDQKYCVQHMHRGRQRSRKLVEDAQVASSRLTTRIPDIPKGESNPGIPVSVGLQLMTTSSSNVAGVSHGSTTTPICSFSKKWIATNVTAPYIPTNNAATATTVLVSNKSKQDVGRDDSDECFRNNCIIGRSNNNNNINGGKNSSPGLDISPKSVVHFQGRCRRTDGKKWRCRRDVIPGEKYCARHMHRGAKKLVKVFPSATTAATHPAPLHPTMVVSGRIDRVSPNTKLSISIPASSPQSNDGEESNSSSSSDTTISDRSITD